MKPRKSISAAELATLLDRLDRQLDRIGLETQPRIALRIVELVSQPDAQIKDYHDAMRTDAALTGRLLRLANSAYFAQRVPITKLERALVLLGIERVRAVSLGFYLSRSAASAGARTISREVWGQSVFRACLAAALVRPKNAGLVSEAFIVGLMLDCGIPLMAKLLGGAYERLYEGAGGSPAKLFAAELDQLEFTHADLAAALVRRWRLPPLLAKPIVWHHSQPVAPDEESPPAGDALSVLQRAAYYVGAVTLGADGTPGQLAPLPTMGGRVMGVDSSEITRAVRAASKEHEAIAQLFNGVAAELRDGDELAERVSRQLVDVMDEQMMRSLQSQTRAEPARLSVAGYDIEMQPREGGRVTVFIDTAAGERVIACTVSPATDSPATMQRTLGLDEATEDEMRKLVGELRGLAA